MSCQQLSQLRKSRSDHNVRVPLGLKPRYIPGAEGQREAIALGVAGCDHKPPAGGEHPVEHAIFALLHAVQCDPDRIYPIGILRAHTPGERVGVGGAECGDVVDREGQSRRPGTLALGQAGCDEQEDQRPWKLAARFSRNAVVPSFMSEVAARSPK